MNKKKYRTSTYTIFIKLNTENADHLLVHGYTGAIDLVSNNVVIFLKKYTKHQLLLNGQDLSISESTLKMLIKRGYFTSKTLPEEIETVRKMAEVFHKINKKRRSFLFMVTYDCNFRCPYCYENGISLGGKNWSKKTFSKESVDKAYHVMEELEPNKNSRYNQITLYGGEPLLKKNKDIVRYIVKKGKEKGYTFQAITNGYELNFFKEILNPETLNSLQITIDGTKERHNQRRTHYLKGETYDKIIENIQLALKAEVSVNVRINTDLNNFNDVKELNEEFRNMGFYNFNKFHTYSALVHSCNELTCNNIRNEGVNTNYQDIHQYQMNYISQKNKNPEKIKAMTRIEYTRKFLDTLAKVDDMQTFSFQDFGIRRKIKNVLEGKGLIGFRSIFCGAQAGMLIFDPYENIYTCWETVGKEKYIVGNFKNKLCFDKKKLDFWYENNITHSKKCITCKYTFLCSGGCMAQAIDKGKKYNCNDYQNAFQKIVPEVYKNYIKTH